MDSFKKPSPDTQADLPTLSNVDANSRVFYRTLTEFAGRHGLDDVSKRIAETWFQGGGIHRVLLAVMDAHLGGSPCGLVAFYRSTRKRDEEPHYEDLTTALLSAVLSGLAGAITSHVLKKVGRKLLKKKERNLAALLGHLESGGEVSLDAVATRLAEFETPLRYVLLGMLFREKMRRQEIDASEHDQVEESLAVDEVSKALLKRIAVRNTLTLTEDGRVLPGVLAELNEILKAKLKEEPRAD